MRPAATTRLDISEIAGAGKCVALAGEWTVAALIQAMPSLQLRLDALAAHPDREQMKWGCLGISTMDSAGAMLLWRAWGHAFPPNLQARPEHLRILERIAAAEKAPPAAQPRTSLLEVVIAIGTSAQSLWQHLLRFVALVGQVWLDTLHVIRHPRDTPWKEISANLYKAGALAMPVTALVGFLLGAVLSYLSSLQLRQFGADTYVVNIMGIGIVRELGPVLVAILVAGRSGSAMTAQLGVMRVTEEIDALATMGVPLNLRLVFSKVLALTLAMPLLVLWASAMALLGGMLAAQMQLDLSIGYFVQNLPRVVPLPNLWIALTKGSVFGMLVGLVACHFGLRVRADTESLSFNTTASVVTAITLVIFVDALFAVATREIGMMPR
jgi:phospholipid/cholesterol/gamma-HCH transport system permease protein